MLVQLPTDFADCERLGGVIQETEPRRCLFNGQTFIEETKEPALGMANPASIFCGERGGELEIRRRTEGETGFCIFSDGSECEEWDFFRGGCAPGDSLPVSSAEETPAAAEEAPAPPVVEEAPAEEPIVEPAEEVIEEENAEPVAEAVDGVAEEGNSLCQDSCGDGECQLIVCTGEGCPCLESAELCPADCQ